MSPKRKSKKTLWASILSLILCVTMLLGTTLAWFTDTVTNKGNRIKAGTLLVDLLMDKNEDGDYEDEGENISGREGDIFSEKADNGEAAGNGILWEPGKTEYVFLQVKNTGSLAVKYDMLLTVTNVDDGDTYKLTDALDYAVIDGMTSEMYNNLYVKTGNESWQNILKANGVQTGDVPEGEKKVAPNGALVAGASDYIMLAVHMDEEATNEYQDEEVIIDVQINATQLPSESDSFGSDYDSAASKEETMEEQPEYTVVELVKNGDLQDTDALNNNWDNTGYLSDGWVRFGNVTLMTEADNAYTSHVGHAAAIYQRISFADSTKEYTLSVDINKPEAAGKAQIFVQYYGVDDEDLKAYYFENETTDGWETVTLTDVIPDGTTFIDLRVRSLSNDSTAICFDNIKLTYQEKADTSNAAEIAAAFKSMIAEEEANSMKVSNENMDPDPYVELPVLSGQPSTILVNGDFENGLNSWVPFNDNATKWISVAEGEGIDGSAALKFSGKQTDGSLLNPIYEQIIDVVGGAEYQVTYWYKIAEGSKNYPLIKFEAHGDTVNDVLTGYAEENMKPEGDSAGSAYIRDGEWHKVVKRLRLPMNTNSLHIMARMMTPKKEDQTAYIDNVTVCLTAAPTIMDINTDQIIYYDDASEATFQTIANLNFFSDLANAKSDFEVYDGQTLVWEKRGVVASEGTATVTMSLAGLRKEVPYCVKATLYNTDGTIADVQTQNIYIYARPEYLGADGVYMKNGEEAFTPVIAYHTGGKYAEVAAAGVNLVQMTTFTSVEQALEYLDNAKAAGVMGFIPLYYNMLPAGADENIDKVVKILSDERVVNHEALFGYGVMDEVFAWFDDPYKMMEDSFRLIRMLDSKHPIMSVESFEAHYNEVGKMVDILVIDPYDTAESQRASNSTAFAKEAVYNAKPVYTLLEAYRTAAGRWLSPEDGRNNNWQALIGGADGIGYYSIIDAEKDDEGNWTIPIWDAKDDGALWNALSEWGTNEKDIAFSHFVDNESPVFNKDTDSEDPYWYYSWVVDGSVYMLVLGMESEQELQVSIPLTSDAGNVKIGAYTAEVIAGDEDATTGNGTLDLTVDGVEAILYKITPSTTVDFSSLK